MNRDSERRHAAGTRGNPGRYRCTLPTQNAKAAILAALHIPPLPHPCQNPTGHPHRTFLRQNFDERPADAAL
jgi:hypothetical protein